MISSALFTPAPAMQSVFHSLNIGTLATWLSVAGLGTVAVITPEWQHAAPDLAVIEESTFFDQDFTIGEVGPAAGTGEISQSATAETREPSPVETLPAPPELAPLADLAPLPEIPALPVASSNSTKPVEARSQSATPARQVATRAGSNPVRTRADSGQIGNGASSGTGASESSRLAAGRMPAPSYPSECRRKGQTGTVLVEFIVDTSGRVISAYAKSESPWPLLNNEAVRTVRRWKFPPGGIMKLQRPIVFQLR